MKLVSLTRNEKHIGRQIANQLSIQGPLSLSLALSPSSGRSPLSTLLLANPGPDVHGGLLLCHTHSRGIDCTLPLAGRMWVFFPTRKAWLRKSTHNQHSLLRISNQHSTLVWWEDYFPNRGPTCVGTVGLAIHAEELWTRSYPTCCAPS